MWPGVVARGTVYAAGQFVRASNTGGTFAQDFDDRIYECTSAGTTHATIQPTYEVTVGNTTTDGTAVFTAREGFTRASEVTLVDNDRELDADAALDAYGDGWFDEGLLVFESGANAGAAYEVKRWTRATRRLELWSAARLPLEVGDRFRVSPGCHKPSPLPPTSVPLSCNAGPATCSSTAPRPSPTTLGRSRNSGASRATTSITGTRPLSEAAAGSPRRSGPRCSATRTSADRCRRRSMSLKPSRRAIWKATTSR